MQIAYLTSDDGLNWTATSPDPVLMTKDVPYAKVAIGASDGTVLDDGTWVLYFYTWNSYSQTAAPGAIGRATETAPTGPWTPDPAPVLNPGSAGSWDDLMVGSPRIVKADDGYRMYYTGYDQDGLASGRIGLATSPDGITWTKYDDPATTDAPYAESDPIMDAPAGADLRQSANGRADARWLGHDFSAGELVSNQAQMSLNYALSDDGLHWRIATTPPFWERTSVPR